METPFAMYDALTSLAVPPEKVRVVVQSMERDLAMFATHSQFSALDQQATARFDLLWAESAGTRERMNHFAQKFADMDRRFSEVDRRFSELTANMNARFDLVDVRLTTMQHQMATMQQQIEQRLTIRLGALLAVAVATTAALVTLLHP